MHAWKGPRRTNKPIKSCSNVLHRVTYLGGTLKVFDAVTVNVVVRSDGLSELGTNNHTRAVSGRTTREKHYPGTSAGESSLSFISLVLLASTAKLTSSKETATLKATPVHLKGLLS